MKVISKRLLKKKNNISYMKSERDILTRVHHPFLVTLCFAFQSQTKLFLVMEFLPGGELFLHLRKRGMILEREVQFYLGEMIIAIDFLHNLGVIHRDLKPENVLLRKDAHVCITDFGLAKEIGDGKSARTLCGTSEYMAPEMLTRNGYGKQVDWWALGALCYEMLVGKPPFTAKTPKELDKKILTEKFTLPSYLTAAAHSLLRGMLEKDMNKRLGCAKSTMFSIGGVTALKQHEFFDGLNWQRLANLELTPPIDLKRTHYHSNNNSNSQPVAATTSASASTGAMMANHAGKGKKVERTASPMPTKSMAASPIRKTIEGTIATSTTEPSDTTTSDNNVSDEKNNNIPPSDKREDETVPVTDNQTTLTGNVTTNNNNNKKEAEEEIEDDFVYNLRYFDTEFTSQVLSRSLIEDTLTPLTNTTAAQTPRPESPSQLVGGGDEEDLVFADFEYIDERLTYSSQQIEAFEMLLKVKQQKANKKKLLKQKTKELKEKEEEKQRQQLLLVQQQREAEAKQLAEQQWRQQKLQTLEQRERDRQQRLVTLQTQKQQFQQQVITAQEPFQAIQKKKKNLMKKLREIDELKVKIQQTGNNNKVDKDQQQKLSKAEGLQQELRELEVEEKKLQVIVEQCEVQYQVCIAEVEREVAELEKEAEDDQRERVTLLGVTSGSNAITAPLVTTNTATSTTTMINSTSISLQPKASPLLLSTAPVATSGPPPTTTATTTTSTTITTTSQSSSIHHHPPPNPPPPPATLTPKVAPRNTVSDQNSATASDPTIATNKKSWSSIALGRSVPATTNNAKGPPPVVVATPAATTEKKAEIKPVVKEEEDSWATVTATNKKKNHKK